MLRFFRINDPYRLLLVFVILIAVRFIQGYFIPGVSYYELKWLLLGEWLGEGFTMYDLTYDYTGPLAALVFKLLDLLFGRSVLVGQVFSSILIIIQAGIFNSLLLKNKVYDENSYLPALLYVILAISIPDFRTLSPQLMSATFVLLTLRNVFRRIGNQVTDELFLSSGLFIGIASMLYLPASIFFFIFLFSLILFSTAILRRLLLYFFGFLLVFVLCGFYFYVSDTFYLFIERAIFKGLFLESSISFSTIEFIKISSPFIVILILSIFKKFGSIRMTNFQQKVDQVMWLLFLGGITTIFISNERAGYELIFVVPVIAYFWTHYFILLKRKFFKAVMPAVLVFGMLIFSGYSYRNLSDSIVAKGTSTQAGTMVIGENLKSYLEIKMSSPFFCAQISEDLTKELDEYESAERIHFLLMEIDPSFIEDHMSQMQKLSLRFPYLEENYKKVAKDRYVKISN